MSAPFGCKLGGGAVRVALLATIFCYALGQPVQAQVTPKTKLVYSVSSTRAPSQALNGSTVSGPVYVFSGLSSGTVAGTPPVSSVTYTLDNGVFTHTENLAPFDFNGSIVPFTFPAGNHVITQTVAFTDGSKETDTAGFAATSAADPPPTSSASTQLLYSVSSTRAPSQPLNRSTVSGPVYVFTGLSTGTVAGTPPVSSVTYNLDNGVFTHTESLAPFDFKGTIVPFTFPAGTHVITETVIFTNGTNKTDTATFTAVSTGVNNPPPQTTPPTVAITAPASGASVSGTITVSASASDKVAVASVQFELDGANLGSPDTAAPYTLSLDTTKLANGTHTLTAVAKDTAGNQATSGPVSITVNNAVSGAGPLRVSTINPRYFTDNSGKAILIASDHTWETLQDQGTAYSFGVTNTFDYSAYLDFLTTHGFNATVLWTWWLPNASPTFEAPIQTTARPFPWVRTSSAGAMDGAPAGACNSTTGQGCKFDFNKFDQAYFDRLRARAVQAGQKGIYVEIMLFNGYEFQFDTRSTDGNPFVSTNNINGISCPGICPTEDAPSGSTLPAAVWAVERAYIHKVIDTVNDLDNVLYYTSNESPPASTSWQARVIAEVKSYEATKPKQHPVGMVFQYKGGTNQTLYNSAADWISPAIDGTSLAAPPDATGQCPTVTGNGGPANTSSPNCKVVINDTDHDCGICFSQAWPWENLTRGNSVQFMDNYLVNGFGNDATGCANGMCTTVGTQYNVIRDAEADVLAYAKRIDLINMTPHDSLSTSGFVLANPGSQYLVYSGSNSFTLTTVAGTYTAEWFNPTTHTIVSTESITVGSSQAFTAPFSGSSVLWLHK